MNSIRFTDNMVLLTSISEEGLKQYWIHVGVISKFMKISNREILTIMIKEEKFELESTIILKVC